MKQGGRLDNQIQKFNQRERAGIRLAWYVVSPRPVKMSAMVRGVVQYGPVYVSVVQCVEDLAATNPSVNSCQPMDQASWPPYAFSLPIQQGLEHWLSQERSSEKLKIVSTQCPEAFGREYCGYETLNIEKMGQNNDFPPKKW